MSLEHKHAILNALLCAVDEDTALEIIDYRKRMGKRYALTERSAMMLAKNLSRCPDPIAAAEEMIVRGWQSVKPEWVTEKKRAEPQSLTTGNLMIDSLYGRPH